MPSKAYRLLPYGVAIASTAIALLLTLWLEPLMRQTLGSFFYIAVIISTWYGRMRSGAVAIILSLLALNYYFIPPLRHFWINAPDDLLRLGIFALVGMMINLLSETLQDSKRKVEVLSHRLQEASSEQLKTALKAAQMGMWDWDMATGEIIWSPEHEQLFDFAPGSFDGKYETFDACIYPDDRDGLNQAVAYSLQNQVPYQHEFRVVWADGSLHWIEGRGKACYGDDGQPVRMSGTIMAIDERKYAEAELRKRERLFSTLMEALPVVTFRFDRDSHCIYINNYWTTLTGRTIESVAGLSWVETLHPEDRDRLTDAWLEWSQNAQQRGLYQNEGRLIHVNGDVIWYYIQALPEVDSEGETVGYIGVLTNITDRKQAEESLQTSEARLRLAQAASNSAVWDWDVQQNTLFWSPEYYQLYELDPTIAPNDENWLRCIHPGDREKTHQQTLQALAASSEFRVEFRVLHADGVRWFAEIGQVLRNGAGNPTRMIGIAIDITQQKHAEIALQQFNTELEQRVAARTEELNALNQRLLIALKEQHQAKQEVEDLYNNALCGYHSLNAEGTVVRMNDTELSWLGYRREEVLNRMKFTDLITPVSQQLFHTNFPQFIQRGWVKDLEFQLQHKNGSTRWVSLNATALKDDAGNFVMSRSSVFDISDRKQAEQALALQAVITRNMAEGICLVKADDASIVYVNPKFEQMFGYDPGELKGQSVTILHHPNEWGTAEEVYQSIRATVLQNREFTYEVHNVRKDGTPFWCSATCSIFQHPEYGNVLVAVQQDITERRKLDQMKQDFISIVSHELRTPLTSIRGSLGLVVGGVYDKKPEKMKEMIAIAARQSDRLVRLVNDILNLRRLEAGQAKFKLQPQAAADLMQQSADVMRSQADQNQITLHIMPTTAEVWADADAIVQTLTNLLSNAIKFSPANSTITITATPHRSTSFTLFSVQDQGRGIPPDHLETIFGQFQQVDASDSREKGGTGLGLAICRTIVKQHGGNIWVESILEQGSTFYFTLPSTQPLSDTSSDNSSDNSSGNTLVR